MANLVTEGAALSRGQKRLEAPRQAPQCYRKPGAKSNGKAGRIAAKTSRMVDFSYSLANQNGFTTTKMTIPIRISVGTSLTMRKNFAAWRLRSAAKARCQRMQA